MITPSPDSQPCVGVRRGRVAAHSGFLHVNYICSMARVLARDGVSRCDIRTTFGFRGGRAVAEHENRMLE
jgi:hypothetical protein